jgi:hypothetical protein
MASIDTAFEVEGFVRQRKELDKILTTNPAMEKKLQGLIRKALTEARKMLSASARSEMDSDPRKAYRAVRTTVYRRILGGNVNILRKKRAGAMGAYTSPRTLEPGQRGGNRRSRSERTAVLQSYQGSDRGFILRFLNAGTQERSIQFHFDKHRPDVQRGSRGGDVKKYGTTTNTGARGHIEARNWFAKNSIVAMEGAAAVLEELIDELIEKELK